MRVAQIKLPLDPAPRLIFQLATTIAIVDRLSLRLNQLELNLVVKVCELPATAIAVTSVLDMFQAVTVMRAERPNDFIRKLPTTRQLVEPVDRCLDRQAPGGQFLFPVGVALSTPRMG